MGILDQAWKTYRTSLGSTYTSASAAQQAAMRDAYYRRRTVKIPLGTFRECSSAGAVGDTTANGGTLASDTTPILGAETTTEAQCIIWAAGNQDIVQVSIPLPEDFDGTENALVQLEVRTDNTGGGGIEAATFTVLSTFNNGSQITDTATDSVPAETYHQIEATIAAADIPDTARTMSLQLVPGTHANDPIRLSSARLVYVSKKQTRGEA